MQHPSLLQANNPHPFWLWWHWFLAYTTNPFLLSYICPSDMPPGPTVLFLFALCAFDHRELKFHAKSQVPWLHDWHELIYEWPCCPEQLVHAASGASFICLFILESWDHWYANWRNNQCWEIFFFCFSDCIVCVCSTASSLSTMLIEI